MTSIRFVYSLRTKSKEVDLRGYLGPALISPWLSQSSSMDGLGLECSITDLATVSPVISNIGQGQPEVLGGPKPNGDIWDVVP